MKLRSIPGINIQFPWSQFLLSGKKTVETRSYALPLKFANVELAIIETPGPFGNRNGITSARIVGTIVFASSFLYQNRNDWIADKARHLVPQDDKQFAFDRQKPKYGWIVKSVKMLPVPLSPPKRRGIVFASKCDITWAENTKRSVGILGSHAFITGRKPKGRKS